MNRKWSGMINIEDADVEFFAKIVYTILLKEGDYLDAFRRIGIYAINDIYALPDGERAEMIENFQVSDNKVVGKRRIMKKITIRVAIMSCILLLLAGCGTSDSGTAEAPDATAASGIEQGDVGNADNGHITVAQVKAAVLENAGLLEEDVRFVRIHLDSENGVSEYDVEFICQDAEYDYKVSAVTGEILSMDYEAGKYDLDALPPDITQSLGAPSDAAQSLAVSPDTTQSLAVPPDAIQGLDVLSDTTQSPGALSEADGQYIGNEAAKQIALKHVGLTESEVRFVHAHLELDDGSWKYDVEFLKDNSEYDYDIDALTGEILSFDQDTEYDQRGAGGSIGKGQITEEQAKQIALEYAGVDEGDAQHLKIELDYDHGRGEYEVEWNVGRTEYSCDVDADTGSILSFEKELD